LVLGGLAAALFLMKSRQDSTITKTGVTETGGEVSVNLNYPSASALKNTYISWTNVPIGMRIYDSITGQYGTVDQYQEKDGLFIKWDNGGTTNIGVWGNNLENMPTITTFEPTKTNATSTDTFPRAIDLGSALNTYTGYAYSTSGRLFEWVNGVRTGLIKGLY